MGWTIDNILWRLYIYFHSVSFLRMIDDGVFRIYIWIYDSIKETTKCFSVGRRFVELPLLLLLL